MATEAAPKIALALNEVPAPAGVETREAMPLANADVLFDQLACSAWLWQDWVPCGHLSVLGGDSFSGKSSVALKLCECVTAGKPWPDGQPAPAKGVALWVDTEPGGLGMLRDRRRDWGITGPLLIPNDGHRSLEVDICKVRDVTSLANAAVRENAAVIVVDSLTGNFEGDENSSRDMKRALRNLSDLAERSGAAVVVVHHTRKALAEEGRQVTGNRLRGSSAIRQFARAELLIDQPVIDGPMRLRASASNLSTATGEVGFTLTDQGPEWCDPPEVPMQPSRTKDATDFLREFLRQGARAPGEVLLAGKTLGFAERTLYRAATKLQVVKGRDGAMAWGLPADRKLTE